MVTRAPAPARGLCRALASFPLGPRYFNTRLLSLPRIKLFFTRVSISSRRTKMERRNFGGRGENSSRLFFERRRIFLPIVVARLCRLERRQRASNGRGPFSFERESFPFFFPPLIYRPPLIKLVTKRNSRHPKLGSFPCFRSILLDGICLNNGNFNPQRRGTVRLLLLYFFFFFNLYSLYKKKKNERERQIGRRPNFPPAYAHTPPFTPASFSISRSLNYR